MDQFSRWSGIAHSQLSRHFPKIKLGQVHQILAAWLGHGTYASLRTADLATLNQKPKYVICDHDAALERADELGYSMTEDQWRDIRAEVSPSGVTPFWLTTMPWMGDAARLVFEDSFDARISALKESHGNPDGHWATSDRCRTPKETLPDVLRFDVGGDACAFHKDGSFVIPVLVLVEFEKIGRRMYGPGKVVEVKQDGPARKRSPEEEQDYIFEGYLSEDD
jgi:hypothetical protein